MKLKRKEIIIALSLTFVLLGGIFLAKAAFAEKLGDSPESGDISHIKELSDLLATLGYGSTSSGSWGDAGTMWNRIYSASLWTPSDATAQAGDVVDGKTFYSGSSRSKKTGTYEPPDVEVIDYSKQSLQQRDDRDTTDWGEASTWTKTNTSPEVWYDSRTGLYWSPSQGTKSNSFDRSTCPFYSTTPRGDFKVSNANCGDAINTCATLSLATHTGQSAKDTWYLPSQKELMQAYVDGIYKKTNTTWVTTSYFWSSTEYQDLSNYAWHVYLNYGYTSSNRKTRISNVRCVLRDN